MREETIPGAARFLSAGRGITMPEPGRLTVPHWITTEAEGRKAVQELAANKVDIVKIWVDTCDGKYKKLTPEIYGAIIDEAHKQGLQVTAHIFDLEDTKGAHSRRGRCVRTRRSATATSTTSSSSCSSSARSWCSRRTCHDRGVKTDLSWLQGRLRAAELEKLEAANTDRPRERTLLRHPGAQPGEAQRGGRAHHARHRRQHAVGRAHRDARHGDRRHDADAGRRGGDAQFRRVPADRRRRPLQAGKSADFIVLDANPLDDITNTRRIAAVYLRGTPVDRTQPAR